MLDAVVAGSALRYLDVPDRQQRYASTEDLHAMPNLSRGGKKKRKKKQKVHRSKSPVLACAAPSCRISAPVRSCPGLDPRPQGCESATRSAMLSTRPIP